MNDSIGVPPSDGPVEVALTAGQDYWWCTCGRSKAQPFCDGSHKGTTLAPMRYQATESAPKWFCTCKQTGTPPFCDGSHTRVG